MSPPLVKMDNSPTPQESMGSPVMQETAAAATTAVTSPCLDDSSRSDTSLETNQVSMMQDTDEEPENGGEDDATDSCQGLTLLTLPPELLLNIFTYLDAKDVVHRLGLVCKKLHELVSNVATWKIRISKRWPNPYPVIPVDDDQFNWAAACMERENEHRYWSAFSTNMDHFSLTMGHIGEIDTVHLMQDGDLCISGSRDRSFHLWDLRKLDIRNPEQSVEESKIKSVNGHKGWVWHVTSRDNVLCTSSWDQWIKLWDVNADCTQVQAFKGSSAFLCSTLQQHEIYAAAFDKQIYIFDRRDHNQSSNAQLKLHKMPVLSIVSDDNYIISGSEDMTIAIFDRRAHKLLKRVWLDKFPMCMSYGVGQLWVGRKDGRINIIDPTHGKFDLVQTYDVGHKSKVTGILHNLGSVITCSTDQTIKVHEPHQDPSTICTIDHTSSLSAVHINNGILAAGGSDLCVNIWKPKANNVRQDADE